MLYEREFSSIALTIRRELRSMGTIFSAINPEIELASWLTLDDIQSNRQSLNQSLDPLQIGAIRWNLNDLVPPHKHLPADRTTTTTQEAWILISGSIACRIYDLNDTFLVEILLTTGSCIVLKNGGHELICKENDTVMYEVKNGEYFGPTRDKKSIPS